MQAYIIDQGEGLKSHLSLNEDGSNTLCGRANLHYSKKIRKFDANSFMWKTMTERICFRCLVTAGFDRDNPMESFEE